MKAYFIQGFFFQRLMSEMYPDLDENGNVAGFVNVDTPYRFMFQGIIPDANASAFDFPFDNWQGQTHDIHGEAKLSNIVLKNNQLKFIKKYLHLDERIQYVFAKKVGDIWIGEYYFLDNPDMKAPATCMLTKAPLEIFNVPAF